MSVDPFFILGTKRGGTTLLRLMLDAHSRVHIPNESHFLLPLFKEFSPTDTLSKHDQVRCGEIILTRGRFDTWSLSQEGLKHFINQLPSQIALSELVKRLYALETHALDEDLIGEKTPEYIECTKELRDHFPGAKFISIARDPRDVSDSLKARGWEGWTHYQRARYWDSAINTILAFPQDDKHTLIRYEDLVQRQEATLRALCDFLGLSFEPNMLEFNSTARARVTEVELGTGIHKKVSELPGDKHVEIWSRNAEQLEYYYLEYVCARNMQCLGYRPSCKTGYVLSVPFSRLPKLWLMRLLIPLYNVYHAKVSSRINRLKSSSLYGKLRRLVRSS